MVLAELSLYPLGKGESVGDYVARCLKIVEQSGMDYQCHAMGTTVEGDLDGVMGVVKRCLEDLATDCARVECLVKIDYRKGYSGELTSRVARVEERVGHALKK
ncbi:MAG: MTH1187 family thiamine-binding protein [Thermoguttaceae bacterium]|jgi:uncharacterized protein (TIGR00106 family)|nr:MTH1187 family thiamine-binding protein [Thermoguttaceae bacterium]